MRLRGYGSWPLRAPKAHRSGTLPTSCQSFTSLSLLAAWICAIPLCDRTRGDQGGRRSRSSQVGGRILPVLGRENNLRVSDAEKRVAARD